MQKKLKQLRLMLAIAAGLLVLFMVQVAFDTAQKDDRLGELLGEQSSAGLVAATSDLRAALRGRRDDAAVEGALNALAASWETFSREAGLRVGSDPVGIAASLEFSDRLNDLRGSVAGQSRATADGRDLTADAATLGHLSDRIAEMANEDLRSEMLHQHAALRRSGLVYTLLSGAALAFAGTVIAGLLRHSRRARAIARRDNLTGLQNRLTFTETLARQIDDPGPGNEVGLLLLDLDSFKAVNDTIGHAAGDELLKGIARRLHGLPQAGLTLARLGGDEFAVIVVARSAHRAAINIASTISQLLKEPFLLDGRPVQATMSVGVASAPPGWCSAADLLKFADLALYEAKSAGRNTFRVYNSKMSRALLGRRELEVDFRQAIDKEQLDLQFQPIVDLKTRVVVGFEALARWNHPRRGPVPPAKFIPLAEEIGLIKQVGAWVLEQACLAAKVWPSHIRVCINVSAHQFEGHDFPATLVAVLNRTGMVPGRIELEITEAALLRNRDHTLRTLTDLKALGVRIALDDFGTGYSSMAHLQQHAFDTVKIDGSFLRQAATKQQSAATVEAITMLASRLGMVTTAEGLETAEDVDLAGALGCGEGQGYAFDRPLSRDLCLARLDAGDDGAQTRSCAAA